MVHIYPLRAVRPARGRENDIAAVPYDVVSAEEAREVISHNPFSFLRISRSDALLPDLDPYNQEVYLSSRRIFDEYKETGLLFQDEEPAFYIYRVLDNDRSYVGIGCCIDTREYEDGIIRRHELTRYDKEEDRTRHIDTIDANTGPVVLLHATNMAIQEILTKIITSKNPDMFTTAPNGSSHEIYSISDPEILSTISSVFLTIPALYIADGHHRCKSAVNVVNLRMKAGKQIPEETYHVLGVIFSEDEVRVHGYSRLITSLSPFDEDGFLRKISSIAHVIPYGDADGMQFCLTPRHTGDKDHIFHLYIKGNWYECVIPNNPTVTDIRALDVSVLQEQILTPFLGITDPRGDPRLQYLGGARPIRDLMIKVNNGEFAVAISMQPVDVRCVFSIADTGGIMPPKSTWFEPKLLSGLLIHQLE